MKKCLIVLFVVVAAVVSQASYLHWQVTGDDLSGVTYNYANLYAVDGSGSKWLAKGDVGVLNSQDVSDYSAHSFFVELVNYVDGAATAVGVGETVAYAQLGNYITTDNLDVPTTQVWHGGAKSVPEPTSGFLMMVGLALLGLKRRKV